MSSTYRKRLLFRDLAAGAAAGCLAMSGSVPPLAIGIFFVGWTFALSNRRILSRIPQVTGIALLASAFMLFFLAFRGAMDLIPAACTFALLLTTQRMLSAVDPTTDGHVHFTSTLTLAGAAALSGDWYFAVFLATFLMFITLSVGLTVLESCGYPEDKPLMTPVRQLMAGAILIILGAGLFFLFLPRLSWNIASRSSSPLLGPATTGFTDRIRLGTGGNIKSNPRPVARMRLSPSPQGERLNAYFLGRTFDYFNGTEWSGTGKALASSYRVTIAEEMQGAIRQEIELLPAYGSRALLAMETPVRFQEATASNRPSGNLVGMTHIPGELVQTPKSAMGIRYVAYSQPNGEALGTTKEQFNYLQLPELDKEVHALAANIVDGESDALRAAQKLKQYLQSNFVYTLDEGEATDSPLSDFLFVRKKGHCEHFATALTILLRTQGFHSRVAAGFFGGERAGDDFVLRAGDAHAWTQVWVPGKGFVTVDATPESDRTAKPSEVLHLLSRGLEWLDNEWRKRVIDYSIEDQIEFARVWARLPDVPEARKQPSFPWKITLLYGLPSLILGWVLFRMLISRGTGAEARSTKMMKRADAILEKHQRGLPSSEGPERRSERLVSQRHPFAIPYQRIVQRYLKSRFGGQSLSRREMRQALNEFESTIRHRKHGLF